MKCFLWFFHKWKILSEYSIFADGIEIPEVIFKCEKCGDVKKKD